MGAIKSILVYTNPLTWICGIPVFIGFVLAAMFEGVATKTKKIIDEVDI